MASNKFDTYAEAVAFVAENGFAFYQAPLDYYVARVPARVDKGGKIRMLPPKSVADPFTADEGHLDRFRRSR